MPLKSTGGFPAHESSGNLPDATHTKVPSNQKAHNTSAASVQSISEKALGGAKNENSEVHTDTVIGVERQRIGAHGGDIPITLATGGPENVKSTDIQDVPQIHLTASGALTVPESEKKRLEGLAKAELDGVMAEFEADGRAQSFLEKYPMHKDVMLLGCLLRHVVDSHLRMKSGREFEGSFEEFKQIIASVMSKEGFQEEQNHHNTAPHFMNTLMKEIDRKFSNIFPDEHLKSPSGQPMINSEYGQTFLYNCLEQYSNTKDVLVPSAEIVIAPIVRQKTGDTDYAISIVSTLSKEGIGAQVQLDEHIKGKKVVEDLLQADNKTPPILHLMLNVLHKGYDGKFFPTEEQKADPNFIHTEDGWFQISTGSAVQPGDLKELKKSGGKVVVTPVEYAKWAIATQPAVLSRFDEYFSQSDYVCFTGKEDLACAQKKSKVLAEGKIPAAVVPICATLDMDFSKLKPLDERPGNFLCFGMIRRNKGIENYAVPFAKVLKAMGSTRKVIVCGSIMRGKEDADPHLLEDIFLQAYPDHKNDIDAIKQQYLGSEGKSRDRNAETVDLMKLYNDVLKFKEPAINVVFEFDKEIPEMPEIFNQARYALNFNFKGLSAHFSGVTNSMQAQLKNYGLDIYMTEPTLREGGKYEDIAKVFPEIGEEEWGKMTSQAKEDYIAGITRAMVADAESLENDPHKLKVFKEHLGEFSDEYSISLESVAKKYMHIYRALPNTKS